jgi:hypothetical protein
MVRRLETHDDAPDWLVQLARAWEAEAEGTLAVVEAMRAWRQAWLDDAETLLARGARAPAEHRAQVRVALALDDAIEQLEGLRQVAKGLHQRAQRRLVDGEGP